MYSYAYVVHREPKGFLTRTLILFLFLKLLCSVLQAWWPYFLSQHQVQVNDMFNYINIMQEYLKLKLFWKIQLSRLKKIILTIFLMDFLIKSLKVQVLSLITNLKICKQNGEMLQFKCSYYHFYYVTVNSWRTGVRSHSFLHRRSLAHCLTDS